jgi:hypothetical protein
LRGGTQAKSNWGKGIMIPPPKIQIKLNIIRDVAWNEN